MALDRFRRTRLVSLLELLAWLFLAFLSRRTYFVGTESLLAPAAIFYPIFLVRERRISEGGQDLEANRTYKPYRFAIFSNATCPTAAKRN